MSRGSSKRLATSSLPFFHHIFHLSMAFITDGFHYRWPSSSSMPFVPCTLLLHYKLLPIIVVSLIVASPVSLSSNSIIALPFPSPPFPPSWHAPPFRCCPGTPYIAREGWTLNTDEIGNGDSKRHRSRNRRTDWRQKIDSNEDLFQIM